MKLRTRLIISYMIIIIVSLSLAFLTLLLIARPIQNRLLNFQLMVQSRRAAAQINNLYRQDVSTERILTRLEAWAKQNQIHLVVVDFQGNVLADSQNVWTGKQLNDDGEQDLTSGTFNTPDGDRYLYAAALIGPADERVGYVAAITPQSLRLTGVLKELGSGFLVAGFVALLMSLLLGVLIARSIARPLQRIAYGAGTVAAGDYEHRLETDGPPEVKQVATSFNVMIEQVESSQRAMRDFVSNVSHELKTPLTSIQGFSQAIMEGATSDEAAQRRAAGIIHQEAGRMARLVEDLLDLARIDSGQVVMNRTPLDLDQIINSTVDRLLPQAARKQIKLVKAWDHMSQIMGDGDRLAQVFTNLLDNAIRHTPDGGIVTIAGDIAKGLPHPRKVRAGLTQPDASTAVSSRGDFVQISITNTGPGIPPEELARIFERFYQVDKSRKQGRGTGLGLTIAKEIIEAHSGYIRAQSETGQGTTFTIGLPLTEADAQTLISPRS